MNEVQITIFIYSKLYEHHKPLPHEVNQQVPQCGINHSKQLQRWPYINFLNTFDLYLQRTDWSFSKSDAKDLFVLEISS